MSNSKKKKRLEEGSKVYEKLANELARDYIQINQCRKCTHPVVSGYCCTFCGTGTPSSTDAEDKEFEQKYAGAQ